MAHFHCKRLFWTQISIHSVCCLEEDCNVSNLRVCPSIFLSLNLTEYGSKLSLLVGPLLIHGVFGLPGLLTPLCYSNCGTPLQICSLDGGPLAPIIYRFSARSTIRFLSSTLLPRRRGTPPLLLVRQRTDYSSEDWLWKNIALKSSRWVHHLWGKF